MQFNIILKKIKIKKTKIKSLDILMMKSNLQNFLQITNVQQLQHLIQKKQKDFVHTKCITNITNNFLMIQKQIYIHIMLTQMNISKNLL